METQMPVTAVLGACKIQKLTLLQKICCYTFDFGLFLWIRCAHWSHAQPPMKRLSRVARSGGGQNKAMWALGQLNVGRGGVRVGLASSAFQFNVEWQMEFFMTCSKSEISQLVDKVRRWQWEGDRERGMCVYMWVCMSGCTRVYINRSKIKS